jgi:hypothetical protein
MMAQTVKKIDPSQLTDEQISRARKVVSRYFKRTQLKYDDVCQFGHTMLTYTRLQEIMAHTLYFMSCDLSREVAKACLITIGNHNKIYITMWHKKEGT